MSLFPFISRKKFGLDWEYQTKGLLWRIVVSEEFLLIGETRDPSEKRASFFCLRADTGVPLWENRSYPEQWWIGIEAVHRQTLYLHEYASPDMPEHKKLIAVDLASGEHKWRNDELKFIGAAGNFVYGRKDLFADDRVYELDGATGAIVKELDGVSLAAVKMESTGNRSGLLFPAGVAPGNPVPAALQNYLHGRGAAPAEIAGVEHLPLETIEIFSWYERKKTAEDQAPWRQLLALLDRDGKKAHYSDIITELAAVPVPDAFFIADRNIIYTKGRNLLRSVGIGSERSGDAKN
jgi:hypothetical protein